MAKKRKNTVAKKQSSKSRVSISKRKLLPLNKRGAVIFAVLFAAIGVLVLIRSLASTGVILGVSDFKATLSSGASVVTETATGSKRNTQVVNLGSGTTTKAVFLSPTQSLDPGTYQVCINARAIYNTVNGTITVEGYSGGVTNNLGQGSYTALQSADYKVVGCTNFTVNTTAPGLQVMVTNSQGGSIRIGSVIIHTSEAVYHVPETINSNCSSEASDALSNWMATVPDGSTITFPANSCYLNNKYIKLANRHNLTVIGNNATFRRTQLSPAYLVYPTANPHWWFLNSSNISIKNMRVEGTNTASDVSGQPQLGTYNPAYAFEAAFRVDGINTFSAEGINISAVWGDGFQLQGGSGATVTSSTIARNGRQAIAVIDQSNVLIDNVDITSSRRAGVDMENNLTTSVSNNIEIRNSRVWSLLNAFTAGGPGAVNNVNIHNNTILDSGTLVFNGRQTLVGAVRRSNWTIQNNTALSTYNSLGAAILMVMTDNILITGNTVPLYTYTQSGKAVEFRDSGGSLVVKNNYFRYATSSYVKDSSTGPVTACSNRLSISGAYTLPYVCPN